MKHLGDITAIHGGSIEPVDVITFGSPCQDLSIAGNRAGLEGERSGLFMEAARIIREMREATNGVYPNFAVWENVPGAFSSNHAEDFRAVLETLAQICDERTVIPRPAGGKWRTVGCIMADGWSIAWRVLDAQFWGVPQRRRRIALVVDFGGQRAPEVLFERSGLRRDFAESTETWKTVASASGSHVIAAGFQGKASPGAGGIGYMPDECPTLIAGREAHVMCMPDVVIPINEQATHENGGCHGDMIGTENSPMYSLTARDRHSVLCMATGQASAEILHDVSPTLNCDHEQPITCHEAIAFTE